MIKKMTFEQSDCRQTDKVTNMCTKASSKEGVRRMQVTEVEADQVCENVALQSQATNLDVKSDSVQKSPIRKCEPCEHGTTRTLDK